MDPISVATAAVQAVTALFRGRFAGTAGNNVGDRVLRVLWQLATNDPEVGAALHALQNNPDNAGVADQLTRRVAQALTAIPEFDRDLRSVMSIAPSVTVS